MSNPAPVLVSGSQPPQAGTVGNIYHDTASGATYVYTKKGWVEYTRPRFYDLQCYHNNAANNSQLYLTTNTELIDLPKCWTTVDIRNHHPWENHWYPE